MLSKILTPIEATVDFSTAYSTTVANTSINIIDPSLHSHCEFKGYGQDVEYATLLFSQQQIDAIGIAGHNLYTEGKTLIGIQYKNSSGIWGEASSIRVFDDSDVVIIFDSGVSAKGIRLVFDIVDGDRVNISFFCAGLIDDIGELSTPFTPGWCAAPASALI